MKGSKVIESFSQSGHLTVLLNYPCIRSTIIDWFLFKWFYHESSASFSSSKPSDSI